MRIGHWRNNTDKENLSTRRRVVSVPLFPQITTWPGLGMNSGLRGEGPTTYYLSHGTDLQLS